MAILNANDARWGVGPMKGAEMNTWNEEVYCWRQLGGRGVVSLAARSYQNTIRNTSLEERHPSLFAILDGFGQSVTTQANGSSE